MNDDPYEKRLVEGCRLYVEAAERGLRAPMPSQENPEMLCRTCKHWNRSSVELFGMHECKGLKGLEDMGCSNDFSPYTNPDFGCRDWEEGRHE